MSLSLISYLFDNYNNLAVLTENAREVIDRQFVFHHHLVMVISICYIEQKKERELVG